MKKLNSESDLFVSFDPDGSICSSLKGNSSQEDFCGVDRVDPTKIEP